MMYKSKQNLKSIVTSQVLGIRNKYKCQNIQTTYVYESPIFKVPRKALKIKCFQRKT